METTLGQLARADRIVIVDDICGTGEYAIDRICIENEKFAIYYTAIINGERRKQVKHLTEWQVGQAFYNGVVLSRCKCGDRVVETCVHLYAKK